MVTMSSEHVDQLFLVYATYLIATASPGPSNMAIMGVAMERGRMSAIVFALGVVTGSMFWALLAATGLSAVLSTYANALFAIKIAGGLYLLYLAWKAANSALSSRPATLAIPDGSRLKFRALYRRGILLHVSNPKAILAWIAIMSLGLQPGAPSHVLLAIIGGCAVLGVLVFCGYALVFSTGPMLRAYEKARRWVEGALALFFGIAGVRLLLSRA